jgi:chromosome segregation protein
MLQRRRALEESLEQARARELDAEEAVRHGVPALSSAQETWYSLAALRERVATTVSIARERMRHSDDPGELRTGRDPDELEREAATVAAQEQELAAEVAAQAARLAEAAAYAAERESAYQAEDRRLAGLVRAAADRREGLARLTGQVNSLRSRAEAAEAEIGRLTLASEQALERAERASRAFTALETKVAGLDAGELGLDAEHEAAVEALDTIEAQLGQLRRDELAAAQERAGLAARVEALHVGLNRKDASACIAGRQ